MTSGGLPSLPDPSQGDLRRHRTRHWLYVHVAIMFSLIGSTLSKNCLLTGVLVAGSCNNKIRGEVPILPEAHMLNCKSTSMLFALCIGALAFPGVAGAVTYVQTSDHCSGATGCGTAPNNGNNIVVTQNAMAGTTTFVVTLASGWAFVDTGANGSGSSLNFGFASSLTNATIINTTSPTLNGWNTTAGAIPVQNGSPNNGSATDTVSTGLIQAPAANGNTFAFPNGIAITCNTNGGSSQCAGSLSFTINTLVALAADTTAGAFFWADVINNNKSGAPTGNIDFGLGTSPVPIPPAALLFGTALAGLGILGRRRRKAVAQA